MTPILPLDEPAPIFEGFSEETWKFLHGLKKNNNKEWFEKHRDDYEMYLRNPMKALVHAMSDRFRGKKLPLVANPRTSMFRINRDIRFSKDKSPYKTHIGVWFQYAESPKSEWCGMYLGMEPAGRAKEMKIFVAGGAHYPESAYLKKIRAKIDTRYKELNRITHDEDFLRHFPKGLEGESLKRMPAGFKEDHPAAELLRMKDFLFKSDVSREALESEDLPDLLAAKCEAGLPVLQFFARV